MEKLFLFNKEYIRFINWCNNNEGFTSAVLSTLTLIVSLIAIIVSIKTAQKPYKRKLAINGGTSVGIGFGFKGIHITAVNIGNIPVMIKTIGIKVGKDKIINRNTITQSQILLKPTETTTQYFSKNELTIFKEYKMNKRIYAYVDDTEGKNYRKYIGKVKNIKQFFLE